jgi:hypothetical protein
MLTWVLFGSVAFFLWLAVGRPHLQARKPPRARLEASLASVASEKGLRLVEGDDLHAEGVAGNVSYLMFAHGCGYEFDAAVAFVAIAAQSGLAFVAWPRDAPESVESFGREIETGDPTFDARFVVLTRSREAVMAVLDYEVRRRLLSLGAPALVCRNGGVWLLLPAVAYGELFDLATSVVARVVPAVARSEQPPYRVSDRGDP